MTIAAALLLTVLDFGAGPAQPPPQPPPLLTSAQESRQAAASRDGSADAIESRPSDAGHPSAHHHPHSLDSRHRIEVRFGGWASGSYDYDYHYPHGSDWRSSGSAYAAFGLEYLNFVRNDLGVGIALTTFASGDGDLHDWDNWGGGQALCGIPLVVRWYPVRRLTRMRTVEPYLAAGIGPVFGADAVYTRDSWEHGHVSSGGVGTTIGGRLGGGVDFRLGRVFTLGMAGAWNWHAGFADGPWGTPGGGEFTLTLGWMFGR